MVQPHNRHMSISLYISVLAVADSVALILGTLGFAVELYHCSIAVIFSFKELIVFDT